MNITRLFPKQFPELMTHMEKIPEFMDVVGTLPPEHYKFLCVIGSRRHSSYGEDVCKKLIHGLQGYPIVIVSGLAIGIDSLAHRCAIEAGLPAMAFPGSGLYEQSIYPYKHLQLAKEIVHKGGALLSPFEPWQLGTKWTFLVRNELMAAISHATLIIEARQGSGTMKTAKAALNLGRDVLIVPGSIFSDLSYGPHTLYKEGATPVFNSNDILEALGFEGQVEEVKVNLLSAQINSLSPAERKIIEYLQIERMNSSMLIEKTGLDTSQFNILISKLELDGLVQVHGGYYSL